METAVDTITNVMMQINKMVMDVAKIARLRKDGPAWEVLL